MVTGVKLACPLPTGKCWVGAGSNPAGVEVTVGVSDHVYSLTATYQRITRIDTTCCSLDIQHMSMELRYRLQCGSNGLNWEGNRIIKATVI